MITQDKLPEIEQDKYTQNNVIEAMCMETYNTSYDQLSNDEKQHIINVYKINKEFNQKNDNTVTPIV